MKVKRTGGCHRSVYPIALRQGINLFCRHICGKFHTEFRSLSTSGPDMSFRQVDVQIRPSGIGIMQGPEIMRIHKAGGFLQKSNMLSPFRYWIVPVFDSYRPENLLPQSFHRFLRSQLREHLPSPATCRYRHNAPGIAIVHEALAIFQKSRSCRLLGQPEFLRINPPENFRIMRCNRDKRRPLLRIVHIKFSAPFREFRKQPPASALITDAGQKFIAPAHNNILCAGGKCLRSNGSHKGRAFNRRIDHKNLILLQINAYIHH